MELSCLIVDTYPDSHSNLPRTQENVIKRIPVSSAHLKQCVSNALYLIWVVLEFPPVEHRMPLRASDS